MDIAQLLQIAFPLSLALVVASVGMRCSLNDALSLFREPGLLLRSVLAMNVVLPLLAIALVLLFDLKPVVEVALVALSLSPVPPFLPLKQLKLVKRDDYVYGILVAAAVLSIVLISLSLAILSNFTRHEVSVEPWAVARAVGTSILVPLAAGMLIRRFWPSAAAALSKVTHAIGIVLLAVIFLVVLFAGWRSLVSLLGDGTLLACIAVALAGLVVGHVLGGPQPDGRTVLALATSSRHPGVAILIGASVLPGEHLVPAAVILYLLVSVVVSVPYTAWRKRLHAAPTDPIR